MTISLRRTQPLDTDQEYRELCACRCPRLRGTHTVGQCDAEDAATRAAVEQP